MASRAMCLNDLLQDVLGEYKQQGFTAAEEADEFVIQHHGELVCRLDSGRAPINEIRRQCQVHLIMNHGISY